MSKITIDETEYCQRQVFITTILDRAQKWEQYGQVEKAIEVLRMGLETLRGAPL